MKIFLRTWVFVMACLLSIELCAQTIFIVRHAEKMDESRNPELSEVGKQRALNLAKHLRDAEIKRVYATEFKRTQMTAEPIAQKQEVAITAYAARDSFGLGNALLATPVNTLVVGHSNTVNEVLKGLGIVGIKPLADDEYDRLIIVSLNAHSQLGLAATPGYVMLRY
jgi:phosphohistidine phosphatase SixA